MDFLTFIAGITPLVCLMIASYCEAVIDARNMPSVTKFQRPIKNKPETTNFHLISNKEDEQI